MIIESIIDLDLYKITMCQFAYLNYPNLNVKFAFTNRTTDVKLAKYIDIEQLRYEIAHVQTLKLTPKERKYLESRGIFKTEFLNFFENLSLSKVDVSVTEYEQFEITTDGIWAEKILWETILLSIVNELYYRSRYQDHSKYIEYGFEQTMKKMKFLSENPDIKVTDFGTRRRFSKLWQKDVISILSALPNFVGTSNVKLAMDLGLEPIGTNAHELYMLGSGIGKDSDIRTSLMDIVDQWEEMYPTLTIALPDTFGTKSFFEDFTKERFERWLGFRHDSGCPFEFGDKVISLYEELGIDPKTKTIVFSDGLNLDKIEKLHKHFFGRINIGFGWGTHLTNDMSLETLSIVMKAVEVISNGEEVLNNHLVKLSDNLNKNMGKPERIEVYREIFEYDIDTREDLIV
jgi:nicotinate phosphoribosyltransferase